MSQPPDDPFYNGPTENTARPPQWPGQGQNKPQQASGPNQRPAYPPPNQGPISMPGFTPQAPGFSPQGPAQNNPGQPPFRQGGFAPQQPPGNNFDQQATIGSFAPQQPPGNNFDQQATIAGTYASPAGQQPNFSPPQQPSWQYGAPPAPNQGPPQAPRKPRNLLLIIGVVLIILLIVGGTGAFLALHGKGKTATNGTPTAQGSPTTTGKKATSVPTQPVGTQPPSTGNFGTIGQPIQAGANWVATLTRVDETTSSAIPPNPGQTYLEISMSLKNVSATTLPVSSAVQFSLVDSNRKAYLSIAAVGDTNIHQPLDANVGSGKTLNGQIPYEVPQSMHDFVLTFEYNLIQGSNASISWQLHV